MNISLNLAWFLYPVMAIVVYWRCLTGPPIFDDNDTLKGIGGYEWRFRAMCRERQRPITTFTYALQAKWPNTIRGLHVGNCLIHAATGIVVQRLALAIGMEPVTALIAGWLFVVHPFAVNTVAYLSGRASLLSTFFGLLAVLLTLGGHPVLALPLLVASAVSKQDGLAFLLPIAILSPLPMQVALVFMTLAGLVYRWENIKEILRLSGNTLMGDLGLPVALPQPQHGWTVFIETLWRIPVWFSGIGGSVYPAGGITVPSLWKILLCIPVTILFLSRFILIYKVAVILILAGPWLIYLLIPVPDQLMDYRNYSIVAGFALIAAAIISTFSYPLFFLVLAWSIYSAFLAGYWETPIAFWTAATFSTSGEPSRAYGELGAYHKLAGDNRIAETYLREAIRLNPRFGPALNNLAWVMAGYGKWEEARQLLEDCTLRCPRYFLGWQDLGIVYQQLGRLDDSRAAFETSLAMEPQSERTENRLGLLDFQQQKFTAARVHFDLALGMNPRNFEYQYNKAVAMKHAGEDPSEEFKKLPQPCPLTPEMIPVEYAK
jgi:Tfp pilus assembly protein PilF